MPAAAMPMMLPLFVFVADPLTVRSANGIARRKEAAVIALQPREVRRQSAAQFFFVFYVEHVVQQVPKMVCLSRQAPSGLTPCNNLLIRHHLRPNPFWNGESR